MYIILDIDQTVADNSHREHFLKEKPKDWDSFFAPERVIKDKVVPGVARVLQKLVDLKHTLVFLTGRNENLRDVTSRWLLEQLAIAIPDEHLIMRPNGNMLSAGEYKREHLQVFRQTLERREESFLIIEDDPKAAAALNDIGVVLKAPECWALLFPEIPEPADEPHAEE